MPKKKKKAKEAPEQEKKAKKPRKEKPKKQPRSPLLIFLTILLILVGIGEAALLTYIGTFVVDNIQAYDQVAATSQRSGKPVQISSVTGQSIPYGPNPIPPSQPKIEEEVELEENEPAQTPEQPAVDVEPSEPEEAPPQNEPSETVSPAESGGWRQGQFLGSTESRLKRYHAYMCTAAENILPENEVWFESIEAAQAAGYTPCGICYG